MEKTLKDCRAFARLEDKVMEKELKGYVCSVEDREGNKKNCRAFAGSAVEARRRLMLKFHDCYVGPAMPLKDFYVDLKKKPEKE